MCFLQNPGAKVLVLVEKRVVVRQRISGGFQGHTSDWKAIDDLSVGFFRDIRGEDVEDSAGECGGVFASQGAAYRGCRFRHPRHADVDI